jgi:hypothetical protein
LRCEKGETKTPLTLMNLFKVLDRPPDPLDEVKVA